MTDDLIQRLRDFDNGSSALCGQAADEIERLREKWADAEARCVTLAVVQRERDALKTRIEDAPSLAVDAASLVEMILPADPVAQTQECYEAAKVSAFDFANVITRAGLPAGTKRVALVVMEDES